jgi:hypothetical protein
MGKWCVRNAEMESYNHLKYQKKQSFPYSVFKSAKQLKKMAAAEEEEEEEEEIQVTLTLAISSALIRTNSFLL